MLHLGWGFWVLWIASVEVAALVFILAACRLAGDADAWAEREHRKRLAARAAGEGTP